MDSMASLEHALPTKALPPLTVFSDEQTAAMDMYAKERTYFSLDQVVRVSPS